MAKRFKLLVFDWDGTLIDSEARIVSSFQAAIAKTDLEMRTDAQIRQIIGLGLDMAIATLYPQASDEILNELVNYYRRYYLTTDIQSVPFPDVVATLESLKKSGYWLAVATGKSRAGLNRAMTESGLTDFFLTSRCADETRSKPDPQMLQEIMAELAVSSQDTLVIGDTEYDLAMANNADVASVAVTYGVHDRERLLACRPFGVF
jgi:phosphoglycolate phosphatase